MMTAILLICLVSEVGTVDQCTEEKAAQVIHLDNLPKAACGHAVMARAAIEARKYEGEPLLIKWSCDMGART